MLEFPWDLPADPSHPVQNAFARACKSNFEALCDAVMKIKLEADRSPDEQPSESEVVQMALSVVAYSKSFNEILGWNVAPRRPLGIEEATVKAQQFAELGQDYVEDMASLLQQRPAHRPSKRRQSHIAAFEFMLASKRNTLGQAVRKFCPCGGSHDTKCRANLKAGIRVLKKVLGRYAPELVDQYDVLHPDRHTKRRR